MLQQYRTIAHPHPYGQEQNANKHTSILRLYSTSLSPTLYPHHKGIASAIIDFLVYVLLKNKLRFGGAKRVRTAGLLRARQALYQLSYSPINWEFCLIQRKDKFTLIK